jgi:glutamyl-tRNA reductase
MVCFMVGLTKIGTERTIAERELFLGQLKAAEKKTGVLLQTCNRVELYKGGGQVSTAVARHLFRVVSGLESSIIGETAIVNQVKTAYQTAAQQSKLDKSIHKLFQTALYVGKRVRKETGISKGAMSHSQAVVNILLKTLPDIQGLNITLLGVNKMNEKIIQFLAEKDVSILFIGNRTYEKAKELADKYNSKALKFDGLTAALKKTDVLISGTSAPHYTLKKETFKEKHPMLIFDLAVPRNIDPEIENLPNVTLYNIEAIECQVQENIRGRQQKVNHAEQIIENEVEIFYKNYSNGNAHR